MTTTFSAGADTNYCDQLQILQKAHLHVHSILIPSKLNILGTGPSDFQGYNNFPMNNMMNDDYASSPVGGGPGAPFKMGPKKPVISGFQRKYLGMASAKLDNDPKNSILNSIFTLSGDKCACHGRENSVFREQIQRNNIQGQEWTCFENLGAKQMSQNTYMDKQFQNLSSFKFILFFEEFLFFFF